MANITLTTIESNLVVDATNNIIQVNSTPTTVVVAEGGGLDIAGVRQAISNVAPILYNNITGVISFDANATFSGKTTDDLAEGTTNLYFTAARSRGNVSATSATGISYNSGTGVFSLAGIPNSSLTNTTVTINGKSVALGSSNTLTTTDIGEGTNLYFTAARARGNVSATDAGGMGAFSYSSGTGVFTYTGPSDSEVRAVISAANTTTGHGNISYSSSTGVITYDRVTPANILSEITAGNVKLKQYSETVFNAGNQSGSVTLNVANGSIQQLTLVGNITALNFTNITAGSTVSLILRQDAIGFRRLITTGWTNWDFVGDNTTLTVDPLAYDILTVTYDGTNYFASLVNFNTPVIQNSQLANSNVVVNGVTIALGSSGNIDTFYSNVTVNGNLNVTGNLNYQNVNDLYVTDQKITLNANATTNSNVEIISNRPTATNTMLKWNEQSTRWEFTNDGTTYYAIATSTTDLAEGSNLWFTTARANSAIDNRLVGGTGISYTAGTVALDFSEFNTGNITEGTNLYFTAARARGNISAAENITYNSSTGVIGLANTLANVNSVSSETSANLTLATNKQVTITTRQRNGALTNSANIIGEGFAIAPGTNFYNAPFMSYNGTGELKTLAFDGTTTAGSNVITGVANISDLQGNPLTTGNILPQYAFCDYPLYDISTIFPAGTYVVSVSGTNVYMSANALRSETLAYDGGNPYNSFGALTPAMRDSTTGLQIILESDFDDGGANAQLITYNFMVDNKLRYGYGNGGPVTTDFTYAIGTASDYAIDTNVMSPFLIGRTNFSADKTVGNFRRGLTVGDTDLTLRGENDRYQTFGLNVLWDGTEDPNTEYGSDAVVPQMLIKQYTDGTNQAYGGTGLTNSGPRLLFVSANGKNTNEPLSTYARANQEIGRITWLSSTSQQISPASLGAPAYISVVSNKDQTGESPSDFGMYLVASANPNNSNRTLWAAQHKANTIISAGSRGGTTSGDIYFAPAREGPTEGNAVLLAERITDSTLASPHWAKIGYDNPTSNTGAKVSVTNGFNTAAGRNGNISLVLDRNDNGAGFGNKEWALKLQPGSNDLVLTEDDVVRTTFSGTNITTSGNVTAGNVITTNIHTNGGTSLVLNANTSVVVRETIKGVSTNVGNITGDGYGFFLGAGLTGQTLVNNSSAGNLDAYMFTTGNATAGSNVITGVSIALVSAGAPNVSANLNLVTPYYTVGPFGSAVQDPFPVGTYVTSVDAANSTITLNNPAGASRDLSVSFTGGGATFNRTALLPGAFDTGTGLLAGLISQFTAGAGASRSTIIGQSIFTQGAYGYPVTGPTPANFVYAIGNSSNYSQGNLPSNRFMARSKIEAPTTVFQAPRGMVVGNGDLTSRAENDQSSSFGVNVLWDGLTTNADYGGGNPFTQLLLKQYSDNSFASSSPVNGGPRILFTASRGNKNQSYLATYPRNNDELGRLTWWGPTQYLPGTSTVNPPAWISGVAGQDFVDTNSGMGMYFANSPNTTTFDRSLYLSSSKGATLIASSQDSTAAQQPVIFAPSHLVPTGTNNGNSVFLYNQTVSGTETAIDDFAPSGAHFAQINYANASALTGSRITVTNGNNFATQHEGNIALSLDRNSNSANVRVACRSGAQNYNGSLNPDRVRFTFAPEGMTDGTAVTISGFTNATVAAALNGNVFYVKRNDSAGYIGYDLYTDSGLTTAVNLGVSNVNAGPGVFQYTRTNSVTAKEWTMVLAQGSNNLVIAEDGVTRTTFESGGNVSMNGNLTITGRHTYDRVYGEFFSNVDQTAANTTSSFVITLNNTGISSDTSIVDNSNITIAKAGIYNIQFSVQLSNGHNAEEDFDIWLRKNGTNVPNTNTQFTVARDRSGNPGKSVAALNLLVDAAAGDVYQLMWAVTNTLVTIEAIPEQTTPYARPATPSVIVTVTPVGA
jgi:hypothetical protein